MEYRFFWPGDDFVDFLGMDAFFSVFRGHESEESFQLMYESALSLFSRDLPDIYFMPDGLAVK